MSGGEVGLGARVGCIGDGSRDRCGSGRRGVLVLVMVLGDVGGEVGCWFWWWGQW